MRWQSTKHLSIARVVRHVLCWSALLVPSGVLAVAYAAEDDVPLTGRTSARKVLLADPVSIQYLTVYRANPAYPTKPPADEFMELEVLLKYPDLPRENRDGLLYRFIELGEITDDTGDKRSPVTEERVGEIKGKLNLCKGAIQFGGDLGNLDSGPKKFGRTVLRLPAPDRKAKEIVSLRGKVEVCVTQVHYVAFAGINKLHGKTLSHPDLKGVEVTVFIEPVPDSIKTESVVRLVVKGETSRIGYWYFIADEAWLSRATHPAEFKESNGTLHILKKCTAEISDDVGLRILIEEPTSHVETYEFDIRNYKLPQAD